MVKKKGKSKRISLQDKYKIQKRVVETHRKNRKQAKRDSKAGIVRHNKKKDPGIPNSWPFKQELLQNIKLEKERMENRKLEEKERKKNGGAANLQELMMQANQKQSEFEECYLCVTSLGLQFLGGPSQLMCARGLNFQKCNFL